MTIKPSQLSANGQVVDEWGTPLRMTIDDKIYVTSAGPDKIFGTADDMANR